MDEFLAIFMTKYSNPEENAKIKKTKIFYRHFMRDFAKGIMKKIPK